GEAFDKRRQYRGHEPGNAFAMHEPSNEKQQRFSLETTRGCSGWFGRNPYGNHLDGRLIDAMRANQVTNAGRDADIDVAMAEEEGAQISLIHPIRPRDIESVHDGYHGNAESVRQSPHNAQYGVANQQDGNTTQGKAPQNAHQRVRRKPDQRALRPAPFDEGHELPSLQRPRHAERELLHATDRRW